MRFRIFDYTVSFTIKKEGKTINSAKLKDLLGDFNYEVLELANCKNFYNWMNQTNLGSSRRVFVNICLEHTLLHSRVLYEFYFRGKYNPYSYPRANMYIKDFKANFTANITRKFWYKVNNQILHLGVGRTGVTSKKFNITEGMNIANDLLRITKDFILRLESIEDGVYITKEIAELKRDIDSYIVS